MDDFVSVEDLETYFKFISNDDEIHTFALFDRTTLQPVAGYGTFHSKWRDLSKEHFKLGTLHLVLNRTNLRGRKLQNIESCRLLPLDIDKVTDKKQIKKLAVKYNVGLIAESSPGKFHLYWKVSGAIPLELWSKIQLGLAYGLGGDKTLCQVNKMLRVPGVMRLRDGVGYIPQIVWVGSEVALTYSGVQAVFPELDKWIELGRAEQKAEWKELRQIAASKANGTKINASEYTKLGRNNALYCIIKDTVAKFEPGISASSIELIEEMANSYNNELFTEPLASSEIKNIVRSAYSKGLAKWEHKKSVYEAYMEKLGNNDVYRSGASVDESGAVEAGAPTNVVGPMTEVGIAEVDAQGDLVKIHADDAVHTGLTNGLDKGFQYDYSDPILRDNRFTELGVIARIRQRYADSLLRVDKNFYAFCSDRKLWTIQTNSSNAELYSFYENVILDITHDPEFISQLCLTADGSISPSKKRKAEEKYMSSRMVSTVLRGVMSSRVKRGSRDIFDKAEELLHVNDGVLNMLTGEVGEAKSSQYLLAVSDFSLKGNKKFKEALEQGGRCPFWEDFLGEVFRDNVDCGAMVNFMQELFGYSLGGSIREQKIFCHYGGGANGKSKVLACLLRLSGNYGTVIDPDELSRGKKAAVKSFERFGAKTEGKRLVVVDDIDVESMWNEGFVKNSTAPTLRARAEYEQSRVVTNRCKIHMGLNVAPRPEAENYGILRRLCVIPYGRTFEHNGQVSDQIDRGIEENIEAILAWAVTGFRRVAAQGRIVYPRELEAAVEEYRETHFNVETAVQTLYERYAKDDPTPMNKRNWEFLTDLVNDVNNYLQQTGSIERTNPESLGRTIQQLFGIKGSKVGCPKRKNMFRAYELKLKFERTTGLAQL